ncbi:MAG TPA: M23 family metallopeptidase [Pyrinomonadaceae bacterium]|jgi:murein DD-endopeptidase MepM/ murein hydrolase activator NlpD|nr:M23 family metallopeptidase [Pyrinomonadaceae bacterium]
MPLSPRARVLLIAVVVLGAVGALVWFLSVTYWTQPVTPLPPPRGEAEAMTPTPPTSSPTTTPVPSPSVETSPTASPSPSPAGQSQAAPAGRLLIPVAGVRPEQLQDTFNDARSEGRVHDAIDIMAPRDTPVLAAASGRVVKLFNSKRGGITLYQLGDDNATVYYYAHLERYADGLTESNYARQGETIAYVGDSGNATPGNTHLHFQVYRVKDPKHFWTGDNLNPYPLLRGN